MAAVVEGEPLNLESGSNNDGGGDADRSRSRVSTPPTPQVAILEIKGFGGDPTTVTVIREIYDSENSVEIFEQQLELALSRGVNTIIIEPFKLGDETSRWIQVGNCLHKTAVLAGFGSIVAAFVWPNKPFVFVPCTILSALCTGLYSTCWQFDPCCKYQVETSGKSLQELAAAMNPPLQVTCSSSSPVVLVRKDDRRRKILHTAVTLACISQTALKLYFPYMSGILSLVRRPAEQIPGAFSSGLGQVILSEVRTVPTSSFSIGGG